MKRIVVERFGGPEVLTLVEEPDPLPPPGQVRVRLTSIGMNHADLMARKGQYKLLSGDPPFTPGLEGGGVIDALGPGVTLRHLGQRVTLSPDATRRIAHGGGGGSYRTHYVCLPEQTIPVPDQVEDVQLGALWLSYLTAWGCMVWKQNLQPGQIVGLPAASSGAALAASQVIRKVGGIPIGLTSSPDKVPKLKSMMYNAYEHILVTGINEDRPAWVEEIKVITGGRGVDVFFDPITAGAEITAELHALAQNGTIWVYGLLGRPGGPVDLQPMIRKNAAIRGWALNELVVTAGQPMAQGCRFVLEGWKDGSFHQHIERTFELEQAVEAHEFMERGRHIGKLVIRP